MSTINAEYLNSLLVPIIINCVDPDLEKEFTRCVQSLRWNLETQGNLHILLSLALKLDLCTNISERCEIKQKMVEFSDTAPCILRYEPDAWLGRPRWTHTMEEQLTIVELEREVFFAIVKDISHFRFLWNPHFWSSGFQGPHFRTCTNVSYGDKHRELNRMEEIIKMNIISPSQAFMHIINICEDLKNESADRLGLQISLHNTINNLTEPILYYPRKLLFSSTLDWRPKADDVIDGSGLPPLRNDNTADKIRTFENRLLFVMASDIQCGLFSDHYFPQGLYLNGDGLQCLMDDCIDSRFVKEFQRIQSTIAQNLTLPTQAFQSFLTLYETMRDVSAIGVRLYNRQGRLQFKLQAMEIISHEAGHFFHYPSGAFEGDHYISIKQGKLRVGMQHQDDDEATDCERVFFRNIVRQISI